MIDTPITKLTAKTAVDAGLIEAVKSGEAIVTGVYSIGKDLKVNFTQRNFFFTDKNNEVILAKFADSVELIKFWEILGEYDSE